MFLKTLLSARQSLLYFKSLLSVQKALLRVAQKPIKCTDYPLQWRDSITAGKGEKSGELCFLSFVC